MNRADRRRVEKILRDNGFRFERHATHGEIWRHSDGRSFMLTQAGDTKDPRGWAEQRSRLRRLGVQF